MKDNIKNKIVISLLVISFIFIIIFTILNLISINKIIITDSLANYMFSHAIRIGEIPYKDFNIITTPLYTFITSIGLFIYDDYIVFFIENLILITITIILMYKLLKQHIIYYLPILLILSIVFFSIFPTYNLLCILLILLLVLLEKEKKSDLLIGLIIGLIILSKHTIGACIFIVGIFLVLKDKKRLLNRLIGVFIPSIVFLIYLLITNSLYNFIDLSILGLFDFSNNNGHFLKPLSIISYLLILLSIILIIKFRNKKYNKISLYYSIASISFTVPIFDAYHFSMFSTVYFLLIILFIKDNKIKINKYYLKYFNIFCTSIFIIIFCALSINEYSYFHEYYSKKVYMPKANHLKTSNIVGKEMHDKYNELKLKYIEYNKKSNAVMIGSWSSLMNIITDKKITYFDVMLYGNFGYNIDQKTKDMVNELHDTYIFIERDHVKKHINEYSQYYDPIYRYIRDNYQIVDKTKEYDIYYKK